MKLNCSRSALENALGLVTGVVSSRTPREALKCTQLTSKADHITLTGTDLEVSIRCVVPQVDVEKEGVVLLPADKLSQIVRELADETLAIELTEGAVNIQGEGTHFRIYSQDPSEFPPVPQFDGQPDVIVTVGVLRRLMETTAFAAARENTRYAINGVLWERKGKKLQLVATDGRRLAKALGPVKKSSENEFGVIVPAKTVALLLRVIHGEDDAEVALRTTGNQMMVQIGTVSVVSVLVEGHFPKYDDVIPRDNPNKLRLKTADLYSAVRRAALVTSDESKGIRMDFGKKGLVLSSRAPQQGEATVELPVKYEGAPLAIGFNPNFLTEALRVIGADEVEIELSQSDKPGMLTAGKDFVYVVMPVSLA
jgi:DNA polymerase-3 subunit beta